MNKPQQLSVLLDNIVSIAANDDRAIAGLALDSREVLPGDAFIALRGGSAHGVVHAVDAIARGARCVLWEPPANVPVFSVPAFAIEHLREQLGTIADRFFGHPSAAMTVTGVTGTNGKTSFVHLLAQALEFAAQPVATIGTLGAGFPGALATGERTTPDVITVHGELAKFRDAGAQHVAMEVSSHALEQLRVDGVAFSYAVFTNLTRDHLDYHGDMRSYGAAKARLFAWPGLRCAIINADDAFGRELIASLPATQRCLSYGVNEVHRSDVRAHTLEFNARGMRFELETPWGSATVSSQLIGTFNVANLLAVAATLGALGWNIDAISGALGTLKPVPGRMRTFGGADSKPLVVVDYAHTPDALEQALASMREHMCGDLHVVFGCGGERDTGKRPLMARVAERGADQVTVTDDNPRSESGDAIVAEILGGFSAPERVHVDRDRARAIAAAVVSAGRHDAVLIAGKGHETFQEIAGVRRPFDDAAVALAALETRA